MSRYKLIALDMDGTLLDQQQSVSQENRRWIANAREAGVMVMLATGRNLPSVMPYVQQLELDGPLVTVNGSDVWLRPGELLQRTLLRHEAVTELVRLARHCGVKFWGHAVEGTFRKDRWPDHEEPFQWFSFAVHSENKEHLDWIRGESSRIGAFEISNSHPCNLEFNPPGIHKASGVGQVCEMLGIGMDEVIAAGDSNNDLALIRAAGLGIAMGNAQEEVKRAADTVAPANTEDGVAALIQRYVFGME
ncbi:HAD family hydrolase [Paenibacillus sp. J2TS4]|uniref:HAD family hydrolase n=1 Tax=Paenibacillus sp. J2TS4 TaxID=2807194 RepID=UPI001B1F9FE7|nr:HAD family hydrolase [Paenibacillus sp. J2TS4]GIP31213.1 5-amino-6-(5-phospho-D-ribitylamino)uracil phosphatase YcsE [Paenibacillus sp. J2TS4]